MKQIFPSRKARYLHQSTELNLALTRSKNQDLSSDQVVVDFDLTLSNIYYTQYKKIRMTSCFVENHEEGLQTK